MNCFFTTTTTVAATLLVLLLLLTNNNKNNNNYNSTVVQAQTAHEHFRWASAGGGWRAMVANMAFANVLSQAGLFSDTYSNFSALSGQSGGSWFLSQFFFAQPFYNNVTQTSPNELAQFVTSWMDSYKTYSLQFVPNTTDPDNTTTTDPDNTTTTDPDNTTTTNTTDRCDPLRAMNEVLQSPIIQSLIDHCNIFDKLNGDWAEFVSGFLDQTALDYTGGFDSFSTIQAAPGSRVAALQQTDFYVQTVLVPMSRIRGNVSGDESPDVGVYIGHLQEEQGDESVNILAIGLQYQISDAQGTGYLTSSPGGGGGDESLLFPDFLVTYTGNISSTFSFNDYQSYNLYPGTADLTSTPVTSLNVTMAGSKSFNMPFDGQVPTIGQLCGSSSAAIGTFSGLVPSTMALALSPWYAYETSVANATTDEEKLQVQRDLDATISAMFYENSLFDDVSVCSQWPNKPCGINDGRFIDGEFSDSPTLGLNIAHYQTVQNGALSQTLKILVTPSNIYGSDNPITFVSYFNNSFNQGIEPGDYYWPSTTLGGGPLMALPIYSPQIFAETLDIDTYLAKLQPVDGLPDVSTMIIQATTITNPIFKTKASQKMEILVIQLNSSIPTDIVGVALIEQWTGPLAEMALNIASSQELLDRVQEFFNPSTSPTTARTSAPTITTPGGPVSSNEPVPSPTTTMEPTIAPAPTLPSSSAAAAAAAVISMSALVGQVSIMIITIM